MEISKACICCGSTILKKSPAVLMPFIAYRVFDWDAVEITDDWGLYSIKNGFAYTVCNSIQCGVCGLLFLDMRFNDNEMSKLYDGYCGSAYTEIRQKYEPTFKERDGGLNTGSGYVGDIERFLTPYLEFPVSILDWGGLSGHNTPFKNRNKLFHIYDLSNKPVIYGAKEVDKTTANNTKYDLIVCANVLEHIPYPLELILDIKKSMTKDTVLYIEIPCEDIIETGADLYNKKKYWHEHINFFTEGSLDILLSGCGLRIIELKILDGREGPSNAAFLYRIACRLEEVNK